MIPWRRLALTALVLAAAATAFPQPLPPAGPEFLVNATVAGDQSSPAVAVESDNGYVVAWRSGTSIIARRFDSAGVPRSGEITVNITPVGSSPPAVSAHPAGGFLVAYSTPDVHNGEEIVARAFDASGLPLSNPILVNTTQPGYQVGPSVAAGPLGYVVGWGDAGQVRARVLGPAGSPLTPEITIGAGSSPDVAVRANDFVVAWTATGSPGFTEWVKVRRFDAAGAPLGPEMVANGADPPPPLPALTVFRRWQPRIDDAADGAFTVVWWLGASVVTGGATMEIFEFDYGTFARRFGADSTPIGTEFQVNVHGPGVQSNGVVATSPSGRVFVAWQSVPRAECFSCPAPPPQDGSGSGVYAREYDAAGNAIGGEVRVNTTTAGDQYDPDVASPSDSAALVVWAAPDGSGSGIFGQQYGALVPAGVEPVLFEVDITAGQFADGNGVLEHGESVVVAPAVRNVSGTAQPIASRIVSFSGPGTVDYGVLDGTADFGVVPNGAVASCRATGDCFVLTAFFGSRPAPHWDAQLTEQVQPASLAGPYTRTIHVGDSYADVPRSSGFYRFVETVFHHGVMESCAPGVFCPVIPVTRELMAPYVLRALLPGSVPPACVAGSERFADVPWYTANCRWIEELARRGVVAGCGGGNYCPQGGVSREQLAVYLLVTRGGTGYAPPACGTPLFADLPASSPFCRWVEELARRGIVAGCGNGNYCPASGVTREQMSVFLSATFGLVLYAP